MSLERRLAAAVAGTPLAERLSAAAAPLLERRASELAQLQFSEAMARGLARMIASSPEVARYLSLRPDVLAAIAAADRSSLQQRRAQLAARAPAGWHDDLEGFVDSLRLLRRDETALAACLDLSGLVAFEEVSSYLSSVAEILTDRALTAARDALPGGPNLQFSVLALGKLAGRELTYHSDLDLIFLYGGDTDEIHVASRLAQTLIHYLSMATGAGTAYAIDSRLRPSGRQGSLVTSYDAYTAYQLREARTWEHLALIRCRAVAGDIDHACAVLAKVQGDVCARRVAPWSEVAEMRQRIASERADEGGGQRAIKAGAGGIMDVDFLATGAQLEMGVSTDTALLPAVPALLETVASGRQLDALVEDYRLLRRVEARARWVAGRAVEILDPAAATIPVIAELVEPGLEPQGLLARTDAARARIQEVCERVLAANSISALAG